MPVHETAHGPEPKTRSLGALIKAIEDHLPGLVGVSVRHRVGDRGRFASKGFEWTRPEGKAGPTVEAVVNEIVTAAEVVDHNEGPGCHFSATVFVALPEVDEIREVGPYRFQLDSEGEGDEVRDDLRLSMQHTTRHLRQLEGMNMRAFGYIEQLIETQVKQSQSFAAMAGPMVELKRLEYEQKQDEAEARAQERSDERTHELVREFGPKLLLVMGAQRAQSQEKQARADQEPQPLWSRFRDACAVVIQRDNVRAVLRRDGVSIAEAIAVADSQASVEALARSMVALVNAGELDPFELVAVAPELMPFAHLLASL